MDPWILTKISGFNLLKLPCGLLAINLLKPPCGGFASIYSNLFANSAVEFF